MSSSREPSERERALRVKVADPLDLELLMTDPLAWRRASDERLAAEHGEAWLTADRVRLDAEIEYVVQTFGDASKLA